VGNDGEEGEDVEYLYEHEEFDGIELVLFACIGWGLRQIIMRTLRIRQRAEKQMKQTRIHRIQE
jgi:hypothetical protein